MHRASRELVPPARSPRLGDGLETLGVPSSVHPPPAPPPASRASFPTGLNAGSGKMGLSFLRNPRSVRRGKFAKKFFCWMFPVAGVREQTLRGSATAEARSPGSCWGRGGSAWKMHPKMPGCGPWTPISADPSYLRVQGARGPSGAGGHLCMDRVRARQLGETGVRMALHSASGRLAARSLKLPA